MSAHSASHSGGWLSALVAHISDYVFEEVEGTVEPTPAQLDPHPVTAVVAAAPRAGASTVARLLAAEMATRSDGSAVVVGSPPSRRAAPPSRTAIRLATALTGVGTAHPVGRLCLVAPATHAVPVPSDRAAIVNAGRYLAPVVLDLAADGSAAGIGESADRIVVVAGATDEPALLDAVAAVIGAGCIKVVNRVAEAGTWPDRSDLLLPDARLGARAAVLGTRALGSLGSAIATLADRLEAPQ